MAARKRGGGPAAMARAAVGLPALKAAAGSRLGLRRAILLALVGVAVLYGALLVYFFVTSAEGELCQRLSFVPDVLMPAIGCPSSAMKAATINRSKIFGRKGNRASTSDDEDSPEERLWRERQDAVVGAFRHAWKGYRDYAFGFDELLPVAQKGSDWFGLGLSIIDSLDTMMLMGLDAEVAECRAWLQNFSFDKDVEVNLFEVTIRALGGLLSAYLISSDKLYLEKAKDLGHRLMGAYAGPDFQKSKIPAASVNLRTRQPVLATFNDGASSTAEVTTIQLEFKYLSHLTGDMSFWNEVDATMQAVKRLPKFDDLVPIFIHPIQGGFYGNEIRFGSRGDSYYEYLLKQWVQTNYTDANLAGWYHAAMSGMHRNLVKKSEPNKLVYIAELPHGPQGSTSPKMDHLVCFVPGMLALGATRGKPLSTIKRLAKRQEALFRLAEELTYTCNEMYARMPSGLAPEIVYFNTNPSEKEDIIVQPLDRHSLLRPETVESLFYMYRLTGDNKYREWGWRIFQAFEKYAKLDTGGYTSLHDITQIPPTRRDKMESFFLAETLKYLYLLFGPDDVLPLTDFVFNTEAHPFPIIPDKKK